MNREYFKYMDEKDKELYTKEVSLYIGRLMLDNVELLPSKYKDTVVIRCLLKYFNIKYDGRNYVEGSVDYADIIDTYLLQSNGYSVEKTPKFDTFEKRVLALELLFKQGYKLFITGENITSILRIVFEENLNLSKIFLDDFYNSKLLELFKMLYNYDTVFYLGHIIEPDKNIYRKGLIDKIFKLGRKEFTREQLIKYFSNAIYLLKEYAGKSIIDRRTENKKGIEDYISFRMAIIACLEYNVSFNRGSVDFYRTMFSDYLYEKDLTNYFLKYLPNKKITRVFFSNIKKLEDCDRVNRFEMLKGKLNGTGVAKEVIINGDVIVFDYLELELYDKKFINEIITTVFKGATKKQILAYLEMLLNRDENLVLDIQKYREADSLLPFNYLKKYSYDQREQSIRTKYVEGCHKIYFTFLLNIIKILKHDFYKRKPDMIKVKDLMLSDFMEEHNYRAYGICFEVDNETNQFILGHTNGDFKVKLKFDLSFHKYFFSLLKDFDNLDELTKSIIKSVEDRDLKKSINNEIERKSFEGNSISRHFITLISEVFSDNTLLGNEDIVYYKKYVKEHS